MFRDPRVVVEERYLMTKPLPKYVCHKEVEALKISRIERAEGKYYLHFYEEGYPPLEVATSWVDRFGPTPRSYWVKYKDGYTSISPAQAFEEGYTRVMA
jgi:hypothetical protein